MAKRIVVELDDEQEKRFEEINQFLGTDPKQKQRTMKMFVLQGFFGLELVYAAEKYLRIFGDKKTY